MALKVVIFYNQFQRGFTETWYMAGTQPPRSFPTTSTSSSRVQSSSVQAERFSLDADSASSRIDFQPHTDSATITCRRKSRARKPVSRKMW